MGGISLRGRAAFALACALLALGAVAAMARVALTQVSSDPYTNTSSFHATEVEPDTFGFGATVVSTFQSGRFSDGGSSNIGWATSTNGGASYSHGFLPGTTVYASPSGPYARDTDPSVAFDAKHSVWMINSLPLSASVNGAAVIVNRSTNGGTTWSTPVTVSQATSSQNFDKNWITCDNTATSPDYGSCYVEWDDNGAGNVLHMAFSRNGGTSWTQSTVPSASVIGGQPLTQPNGTVIVPIDNGSETAVESFVSTNGGVRYTGPFAVATVISHREAGNLRSPALPTAAVDGAGKVYVGWADCRFVSGCAANDIVYSTSSTGKTWSAVTRIPIDSTSSGKDHFIPGLGIDRTTSGATAKLALTYYFYPSTSCTTSTCQLDVGFVRSSTGGASWTSPLRLAGPTRMNELPLTTQGYMVGDYLGTAFVTAGTVDKPVSGFAVGFAVTGKTCTLGQVTSCNEPMEAFEGASGGATVATRPAPILSTRSDRAATVAATAR